MIKKLRNILSIEQDEYFEDETLLQYINKAEQNIVSLFVSRERVESLSYRALDNLRDYGVVSLSSPTPEGSYFKSTGELPTDLLQYLGVYANNSLTIRELTGATKIQLLMGNAKPNAKEGFFQILSNRDIEVYTNTDTISDLTIYYTKKPTPYSLEDNEITNLPTYLENAVLYYAAYLAVTQENVAEMEKNAGDFYQIYTNELQIGSY